MSNYAWYKTPIPEIINKKVDFERLEFEFYLDPSVAECRVKEYKIPNFFIFDSQKNGRPQKFSTIEDLHSFFNRFVPVVPTAHYTHPGGGCINFQELIVRHDNEILFDKESLRKKIFIRPIEEIAYLDIDFDGQNHAFMYIPIVFKKIIRTVPLDIIREYDKWLPIDAHNEEYSIVGKFNLITWQYEDGVWLVKKKDRVVKVGSDKLKGQVPSMLDFIFKK